MPELPASAIPAVTQWFEENFQERGELGASVSIWKKGVEILSLAQGFQDRGQEKTWDADTLVPVWSATKGPAAVCALDALDKAGMSLDRPVAEIWPEFAQGGKGDIRLFHVFSHTAGLSALDEEVSIKDYAAVIRALEKQTPLWEPGMRQGYHARTFGFLLDEIVRRLTEADSLGQYFSKVFREPLDLDFWIGLPEEQWGRVAHVYPGRFNAAKHSGPFFKEFSTPGSLIQRTFASPKGLNSVSDLNQPEAWSLGIASMGGVGSARGMAKFYSMLAQGGKWNGQQIVSELVVRQLRHPLSQKTDAILSASIAFAAGVMQDPLNEPAEPTSGKLRHHFGTSTTAFGHPGAGGSLAFADPENGLAFAYVMNQMELGALPNEKALGLVNALYSL